MRIKWTFDSLKAEALKFKTKGEFKRGNHAAYKAAVKRDDYDLIVEHMPKYLNKSGREVLRINWTRETLRLESLKYGKIVDFVNGNKSAYYAARRIGKEFLKDICSHMEPSKTEGYTTEELKLEALKYTSRGEFRKGSYNIWNAAHKRGIAFFDSICTHMPKRVDQSGENNPNFRWKDSELQIEASKYSSRSEFENNNPGAVQCAKRRGIYEQVCVDMKPSRAASAAEKELFSIIKNVYPQAKKFRDRQVKIPGKIYIKGFEIDILVDNLGIEYDGTYHHSYEYMRKDPKKFKWSDDDIRNYHEIKDSWFASKGIKILHIKEEDWKKDKQACIDKCLIFLGLYSPIVLAA